MSPIRPKNESDLPELIRVLSQVMDAVRLEAGSPIGPLWTAQQVEDECHAANGYVAYDLAGRLLGFILYRDLGEVWEIGFLATAPEARGKGVMVALLRQMLADQSAGSAVWLEVHEANQPARALYEKVGFKIVGTRPRYYSDGGAAILYSAGI
jgi:ribosomal-protein-alanine N-acetyltransferase